MGESRVMNRRRPKLNMQSLPRAIRDLPRYRRESALAYGAMLVATLAQLAVPQLVQNILDSVTRGLIASGVLGLPAQVQALAAQRLGLGLEQLTQNRDGAQSALLSAGGLIVAFALVRGAFAFTQAYMGERVSQSVAFDLRNELFAKIQRLSFSYHDRHRTGQLMVRATDDVEKVRTFIGQGLLMALQSLVLMVGAIVILFTLNPRLTLVVLPILPAALLLFVVMGGLARPMFER